MKKNYNILKEFRKGNIKFQQHYLLFDIYNKSKKEKFIQLIYNINRYYKKNRLGNKLKENINDILKQYTLKFFNNRGIIYDMDLFKSENIINILFPILLGEEDVTKLNKILNSSKKKNISDDNMEYINGINFRLSEIYLNGAESLLDELIDSLNKEYDKIKDIIPNKQKEEGSIFIFIEKGRHYFVMIYKGKVYPFNIYLKNNKIIVNKDTVYANIYNKSFYIFNNYEFYKIKKINKTLIESIICKFYDIDYNKLNQQYILKSIFKKDIVNVIKKIY